MTIPPLHKFPALSTLLCFVIHLAKLRPYLNPNLHTLCNWMGLEEIPKPHWLVLFIHDHKSPVSTFCALSLIWSVFHSWLYTFSLHGPPAPPLQPSPVPDKADHFIIKLEAIRINVPQICQPARPSLFPIHIPTHFTCELLPHLVLDPMTSYLLKDTTPSHSPFSLQGLYWITTMSIQTAATSSLIYLSVTLGGIGGKDGWHWG